MHIIISSDQLDIITIFLIVFFFINDKIKVNIELINTVNDKIITKLNKFNVLKQAICSINSIINNIIKFKENNSIIVSPLSYLNYNIRVKKSRFNLLFYYLFDY